MRRMEDGRIPKDILYGELASGKRPQGHPQLRYKDVCKCDMKALDINTEIWEDTAANRSSWRCLLKKKLNTGEEKILKLAEERRARRKAHTDSHPRPTTSAETDCHSRIGLTSHRRCGFSCNTTNSKGAKSMVDKRPKEAYYYYVHSSTNRHRRQHNSL